jgi:hypothetical protein
MANLPLLFNQYHNFACIFVWVWNLLPNIKGKKQTEVVWEQGAEENIWTEQRWYEGKYEKTE